MYSDLIYLLRIPSSQNRKTKKDRVKLNEQYLYKSSFLYFSYLGQMSTFCIILFVYYLYKIYAKGNFKYEELFFLVYYKDNKQQIFIITWVNID